MEIAKLPKWAREHIEKIQRQRDNAVKALNDFTDHQTLSPVWSESWVFTGEQDPQKRMYIHADEVSFKLGKGQVDVQLRSDGYLSISTGGPLVFVPGASNVIYIQEPERG